MDALGAGAVDALGAGAVDALGAGAVDALGAGLLPRLGLDRAAASVRFILRRRAAVKAPSAAAVRCDIAGGAAGSPSAAETPESQSMTVRTNRQSEEQQGEQQLPRERIPFHRDASLVVVSVALNEGFEGAQLLFALDGRIQCPARRPPRRLRHSA